MREVEDSFGYVEGVEYSCTDETLYIDVRAWKATCGILPNAGTHDGVVIQVYLAFRHHHPGLAVRKVVIKGSPN